MLPSAEENKSWSKEKEALKLKFEIITNRYVMFEDGDSTTMSEKLQLQLAKTKEELHKIIASL